MPVSPLTAPQRARFKDRRWLYEESATLDATGNSIGYVAVEGEQNTPGLFTTTSQFDARNSVVGLNNRDNLDTADAWAEQSGRATRPGHMMKVVQAGSTEELWYVVRGSPKNRPTRGSLVSNWQMCYLAIQAQAPTIVG